jgi:uncharacterized protein (DUF983 family)
MDADMSQRNLWPGLGRGFAGRCPNCGQGPLLHRYLKVVSPCTACGHDNGQYPSDDAPPYFTILIVGHVVIAPLVVLPVIWTLPAWLVLSVALPVVGLFTLLLLPRVKGAVIGVQWAIKRNEGGVPGQDDTPDWARPSTET